MKIVVTEGRDLDIALEGHEGGISIRWDGKTPDITLHIGSAQDVFHVAQAEQATHERLT
jgi:hypothetical protein